jgi:hypothetical protein
MPCLMPLTRSRFLAQSSLLAAGPALASRARIFAYGQTSVPAAAPTRTPGQGIGVGGNSISFDMAAKTNINVVNAAMKQIPTKMARELDRNSGKGCVDNHAGQ